jgi:hypothetical protein
VGTGNGQLTFNTMCIYIYIHIYAGVWGSGFWEYQTGLAVLSSFVLLYR